MVEQIRIDHSVIPFMMPKFHLGQKVQADGDIGHIIGLKRDKYAWSYCVVEGAQPTDDSGEEWHEEHKLSAVE
ncbi:hypothetical protein [Myxacorys almedinensis]|uniref:Uncharacterized protein n=1 Tax=Myxacorys almedinensis A TaxID=2690445 RepID=A0A8J7YZA3_9CYAN|nr:hypothetical protein [Myxacorys almedinensis]NDJ16794.1 hypothetical protein [Myxacorys almedinensis A]